MPSDHQMLAAIVWFSSSTHLNKPLSAKRQPKRVVFAEGEEPKIIRAAWQVREEGIGEPILVGRRAVIEESMRELGAEGDLQIQEPEDCAKLEAYAQKYFELRRRKGLTFTQARRRVITTVRAHK